MAEKKKSAEELAAEVAAERQERAEAFGKDLDALAKARRCRLVPVIRIVGTEIAAGIEVVAE